jgi:hypothetical protein
MAFVTKPRYPRLMGNTETGKAKTLDSTSSFLLGKQGVSESPQAIKMPIKATLPHKLASAMSDGNVISATLRIFMGLTLSRPQKRGVARVCRHRPKPHKGELPTEVQALAPLRGGKLTGKLLVLSDDFEGV